MEKEFKIGDTVELLRNSFRTNASLKKGDIGNITKIEGQIAYVNVSGERHNSNNNAIHLSGLKLLKNELPTFKIIKYRNKKITMVQNNEGNIFGIGDKISLLPNLIEKSQMVKNRTMKITGFRYRKDKGNLCAITDLLPEYGIGIEKIQHVLEFEKEFVLPEKWYVHFETKENYNYLNDIYNLNLYYYPDAGLTNIVTFHKCFKNYYYSGRLDKNGTKITFEQFKKYVLKEELVKEETLLEKAQRLYTQGTIIRRIVGPSKNSDIELKSYTNNYEVLESTYNGVYAIYASNYVIYTHEEGWAKILNPKLKVGDTFLGGWSKNVYTITKIETIEDQEIAFFKDNAGYTSNHHRILTKNIKEWTSV